MPKIDKLKPKVQKKIGPKKASKKQNLTALAIPKTVKHSPKSKTSPTAYYKCLLTYANQNWHHPVTGQKKKITACCKECKQNAPALNNQREKELVKFITSYKQMGESFAKLLKPIK